MTYLGIDIDRSAHLGAELHRGALGIAPTQQLLLAAQRLADLPLDAVTLLDTIEQALRAVAIAIEDAVAVLGSFVLDTVVAWSGAPLAGRADGQAATVRQVNPERVAWDQVEQVASHNSYAVEGGISWLYSMGLRAFELDIHRGAPTDLTPPPSPLSRVHPWLAIAADHLDHQGGRPDDWRVYHVSGSAASQYEYLSDGLQAVAAVPADDPVTVFIDNKDAFGGTHTPDELDALVARELGDRLYTRADLVARDPDATTTIESVRRVGWPTVAELQGKVFVVLTGELEGYENELLFIAPPPTFSGRGDDVVHLPEPDVVFYNAPADELSIAELRALHATTSVVRTYFNAGCDRDPGVNYRAIDVAPGAPSCARGA